MHCCRGRLPLRPWQDILLLLIQLGPALIGKAKQSLHLAWLNSSCSPLQCLHAASYEMYALEHHNRSPEAFHCLTTQLLVIVLTALHCCRSLMLIKLQLKMLLSLWSQCEKGGSSRSASMRSSQTCGEAELSTLNALLCGKASPALGDAAVQFSAYILSA